jgi:hypothetical protein
MSFLDDEDFLEDKEIKNPFFEHLEINNAIQYLLAGISFRKNYMDYTQEVEKSQLLTSNIIEKDNDIKGILSKYFGNRLNLSNLNSSQLYRVMQVKYWEGKLMLEGNKKQ